LAGAAVAPEACARDTHTRPAEALGLLYDSTLCIGCKACVAACKAANNNPAEFSTEDQLWDTPLDTSGYTFNIIKMYRNGTMETKDAQDNGFAFMKTSCMHCADPSCVSACPVSAMVKDPVTGIVAYDPDICVGCRYCVVACPFGIPKYQYDSPTGQIGKCELCRHRYQDGHYSACAEVCPTGATLFGRVDDLKKESERRLQTKPGDKYVFPRGKLGADRPPHEGTIAHYQEHVYGLNELGGTQIMYMSAIPFDKLGFPVNVPNYSYPALAEGIQHTLYKWMLAPAILLGGLSYVVHRNTSKKDDEKNASERRES